MDSRGYVMAQEEAEARLKAVTERLTRERDDARAEADRLREHLRTAEGWQAEANNLRAMLREWWESVDECPFCGRWKTGHAPDCRLAAELKEGRDE